MPTLNRTRLGLICCLISGAALLSQIAPKSPAHAWEAAEEVGTLSGQVVLKGEVPMLAPLITATDPKSADLTICGIQEVADERLIVDPKSKGIANVFVYLKKPPVGMPATLQKSKEPVVRFGQKDLRFFPHALLIRTDQTAQIQLNDKVGHHAHFYPVRNPTYSDAIKAADEDVHRVFKVAESLPILVKCDIHPWMRAWWLVLDHPYAAITDANGKFRIANLPPGEHEFIVWHESASYIEKKFKVTIDGQQQPPAVTIAVSVEKFKLN